MADSTQPAGEPTMSTPNGLEFTPEAAPMPQLPQPTVDDGAARWGEQQGWAANPSQPAGEPTAPSYPGLDFTPESASF